MFATKRRRLLSLVLVAALVMAGSAGVTAGVAGAAEPPVGVEEQQCDFHEDTSLYVGVQDATPMGESYMLYEHHGGTWCDAEKLPPDDGPMNPPPVLPNEEDDWMCWAAAASNVLEWTGWGLVGGMADTDAIFQHFEDHWTDMGGMMEYGWNWWFDGTVVCPGPWWSDVDVPGGGNYWPGVTFADYFHEDWTGSGAMQAIDGYLHNGWGVALGIYDGGHAITCWGFNYDPGYDPATNPEDHYVGIWVTDSDDDKSLPAPPDRLRYYEVEFADGRWYIKDIYGRDWHIGGVQALEPACVSVEIDIKPCISPNTLRVGGHFAERYVQVAIVSTPEFDACSVDPSTVTFGPNGARPVSSYCFDLRCSRDFRRDLILTFPVVPTGLQPGDTSATLEGETYDGKCISGTDSVVMKTCTGWW